jgi:toxin ParE1/3/4
MAKLIVSWLAQFDEVSIARDLTKNAGVRVAVKYAARFDALFTRLSDFPEIGAPRPALGEHVRISAVSPFTVPYHYDAATDIVTILRIIHGRRKLTAARLYSDQP